MLRKYSVLGQEFIVDTKEFEDFLGKLRRGAMRSDEAGIVTTLNEFDRLAPERKIDYLQGFMMFKGDWLPTDRNPERRKKRVSLEGSDGRVGIPLPV